MSKHSNLPYHFYVNVDNKFLGPNMPKGVTPAIWHAVYGRPYQLLLCHAISTTTDFSIDHKELMPWKTMGEDMDVVEFNYLEGLQVSTKLGPGRHTGIIVDWKDGYSRYQQEHKPLNLIHLQSGQFALQPNNYCKFEDGHFTSEEYKHQLKFYRRGEEIYWE